MFEKLTPPYVFAHRGASAHAPENTLAAFQLALEQGAPAIEFDVKLTLDGRVIILHDTTLERTTDGFGRVTQLPFAALRELDAGSWFDVKYRGEKIPALDEVFEAFGRKLYMNIELANYATPFDLLVENVVTLVQKYALEEFVLVSSFLPFNLTRAAHLLPNVPRGQLADAGWKGWWQRAWGALIDVQAEHPYRADVSAARVASAHARGRRMHAWTVNDAEEMRRLRAAGVDGLFSDDPRTGLENFHSCGNP